VNPPVTRDGYAWPGSSLGLEGRSVLVSGALGGVGRAAVTFLATAGATVMGVDRVRASEAMSDCRALFAADVANPEEMADVLSKIENDVGFIDCLVNNAASLEARDLTYPLARSEFRHRLVNNVEAVYVPSRIFSSALARRPGAAIVNVSSIGASRAFRGSAAYVASKGAVEALTRALAIELAPIGIRVNGVAPAMIATDTWTGIGDDEWARRSQLVPLGRPAEPAEIASVIAFLLSPLSSYVTGQTLVADGGLTAGAYPLRDEEALVFGEEQR
jgi:3-oxoacyl-[acyl-carrier protein] reductase